MLKLPYPVTEHLNSQFIFYGFGRSFATVNRWENAKTSPSKLARTQFNLFCKNIKKKGKLND